MLAKIAARNRFYPEFGKVNKKKLSRVHRRPFRQSLAGVFRNLKTFLPSIVEGHTLSPVLFLAINFRLEDPRYRLQCSRFYI